MKLFCYGSLKSNKGANSFLGNSKFLGEAILDGYGLYPVCTWPGIKPLEGGTVVGELYEIDENQLADCDRYEGYPDLFGREEVIVYTDLDPPQTHNCWVYVYNGDVDGLEVVANGIW